MAVDALLFGERESAVSAIFFRVCLFLGVMYQNHSIEMAKNL